MCSECMLLLEECPELSAIQEMHQSMEARHFIFFLQLHVTSQHSVVGVHARHDDNRGLFSMDVF